MQTNTISNVELFSCCVAILIYLSELEHSLLSISLCFILSQASVVSCTGHFTHFNTYISSWLWTVYGWKGRFLTLFQHVLLFVIYSQNLVQPFKEFLKDVMGCVHLMWFIFFFPLHHLVRLCSAALHKARTRRVYLGCIDTAGFKWPNCNSFLFFFSPMWHRLDITSGCVSSKNTRGFQYSHSGLFHMWN